MWPTFYIPARRSRYPTPVIVRTIYTTPPYPIEAEDALESSFPNVYGSFGLFGYGQDDFETSWTIVSGELRAVLRTLDGGLDDFESAWTIVSGELRVILRTLDAGQDSFEGSFAIVSGALPRILIVYEHPVPDDFESSFSIVSGALT
jgi:hypothetical protein